MLYNAYQSQLDLLAPFRAAAGLTHAMLREPFAGPGFNPFLRTLGASAEIFYRAQLAHERPDFDIGHVVIDGAKVNIAEDHVFATPFGNLIHFRKETPRDEPRILLVAPMAGHFSTLLRNTVETLLPGHDVYLTDWKNARDIPRSEGRFGLDEYIEHLIGFLEHLGPGTHVMGVCQPCAALLAAVAIMAEDDHPCQPPTMTLMAGPVDTRQNPTAVNEMATSHPIEWFERNLITVVPRRYPGAHRRVYPGFLQVTAFMSMNMTRHWRAHMDLFGHIVKGRDDEAEATRDFYDEYFAVLDMPAEFYLETVRRVFQEFELPRGVLEWRGRRVDPSAIRRTALLTVEGERDDICGIGQTSAAHTLCTSVPNDRRGHHLQAGAGHYGVFSGRRWQNEIYPIVRGFIALA